MTPRLVITLLAFFSILTGTFIIYQAYKNKHREKTHKKVTSKLIQALLGDQGTKYFLYIFGSVSILFGSILMYFLHFNSSSTPIAYRKTEKISIQLIFNGLNNQPTTGTSLISDLDELNRFANLDPNKYNKILKISFKNNYLNSLPNCIQKMNNLNELDIRNNNISKDNLSEVLKKLREIKLIKIYGNESVKHYEELKLKYPSMEIDTSGLNLKERASKYWD